MRKLLLVLLLQAFSLAGFAQDFNAALIPDSLLKGADVVKRYEEYILEIKSPGKAKIYERHVYTILNDAGIKYAKYKTYYDKFTNINSVSGVLYNALGKEIKHLKKKDWQDMSVFDGISLVTDERVKENEFFYNDYPFTVDYEEEDEKDGIMSLSSWYPLSDFRMSAQYSKYTLIAPEGYTVRFKPQNLSIPPTIIKKDGKQYFTWEIKNIPAKKYEESAPPISEILPNIQFAPSELEAEGYKGNMSNWENYGKFLYQLIKGRDNLPDNVKQKVHELTDHLPGEREKINVLYDFLQKNTHYISIQLGIGGWQPFDATYVAEKKYGDCKALSNYMIALLKEAGIKAKYVEIYGGSEHPPFMEDFPCLQSNHVICCVPLQKDTVWLECTSQTKSPGYMGSFTGGRKAVILDENGGHIVNTPAYAAADNLQYRITNASINENGLLDAVIHTKYTGEQQELPQALIREATEDQRKKFLNEMFNLPTYQVISNEYEEIRGTLPAVNEKLHITADNFASVTGKRLFIMPYIFGGSSSRLLPDTARKYDYIISTAYKDIDSIVLTIPAGYTVESQPKNISLENKYGKYVCTVTVSENNITYYRCRERSVMRIPAKEYNDYVKFIDQVYKTDRSRIVFVKKD